MYAMRELKSLSCDQESAGSSERGAGVVEWLGISALSIVMLVGLFAAVTALGDGVIEQIRNNLGL